jgi:hypothetical protein
LESDGSTTYLLEYGMRSWCTLANACW